MSDKFEDREVGDTIRFESELFSSLPFDDTEKLTDADTIHVTIENRDEVVVDEATPTEHKEGQYYYEWGTQGLEPTQYKVTVFVRQGDAEEVTTGFIELTEH